jgi:Fe-S cluster assembly protein SufD
MIDVTDEKDLYLTSFEQFEKDQAAKSPGWVHTVRKSAMEQFARLGFPTTRDEEWRFTSVAALGKIPFQSVGAQPAVFPPGTLDPFKIRNWTGHLMVFLNGRFSRELSSFRKLPNGLQLISLATALQVILGLWFRILLVMLLMMSMPFL